jgi:hypothetical protein
MVGRREELSCGERLLNEIYKSWQKLPQRFKFRIVKSF